MKEENKFYITKKLTAEHITISLHGELDLSVAMELQADIDCYVKQSKRALILDMQQLTYIDSTGIGMLIQILKQRDAIGGKLKVVHVPERIMRLFDITGITQHLDIEDSLAAQERKEEIV